MRLLLTLLVLALPFAEIAILVRLGQSIGLWPTLGVVLATALAGLVVLSRQGVSTLLGMQAATDRGEAPLKAMLEGALLAVAGVLLISPGLICDSVGVCLLLPPARRLIASLAAGAFLRNAHVHVETFDGRDASGPNQPRRAQGPVIEGEFERLGERPVEPEDGRPPGDGPPRRP